VYFIINKKIVILRQNFLQICFQKIKFMKYLPAEWEEQDFVQMVFPHEQTDWAGILEEVCGCFCEIIEAILPYEKVLVVLDKKYKTVDKKLFELQKNYSSLFIVNCSLNDTWARDASAITIFENGKKVALDFTFNGWGLKFAANFDNQITKKIFLDIKNTCQLTNLQAYNYRDCRNFILEGGSIESDSRGTILTTEKCLLSENRNYLSKTVIEKKLKEYFGATRILWLKNGSLAGDDTDSHIDTLARFCNENTIAYVKCEDEADEHFAELKAMENELKTFRNFNELPYSLAPLPMADKVVFNGERLPATYANFLIINSAVLLPTYDSPKDKIAEETLQKIFFDRKIIKINCLPLIKQHGSLHCTTMQFPK
jgi:agmatine/peptidylarginine deiminase